MTATGSNVSVPVIMASNFADSRLVTRLGSDWLVLWDTSAEAFCWRSLPGPVMAASWGCWCHFFSSSRRADFIVANSITGAPARVGNSSSEYAVK